jgi:hypothetical protein
MNIMTPPKLYLWCAAILASVVIALAGAVTLSCPVLAVVALVTTSPIAVIFSRMPFVCATEGAKAELPSALQRGGNDHVFAALFAIKFISGHGWRLGCNKSKFASLFIAIPRANRNQFGAYLKRLTSELTAAHLAGQGGIYNLSFTAKLIRALTTTSSLASVFQPRGISKICLFTVRACHLNHIHIIT